ncbi:P2Y purinoceptor 14-like [Platichthys flesus]|uniref:P2Y purinoceptor 14-like n=1 Tax=Platichthys flesus TaxID=8260 RepID=UPI002DB8294D|nr:P2Y purinoceptor 14-like [Platichthys flesus]
MNVRTDERQDMNVMTDELQDMNVRTDELQDMNMRTDELQDMNVRTDELQQFKPHRPFTATPLPPQFFLMWSLCRRKSNRFTLTQTVPVDSYDLKYSCGFSSLNSQRTWRSWTVTNTMNVSNRTDCDQVKTPAHVFFMLVYSLQFLVGLLLNGFTLKVYFCRGQQQTTSSVTVYLKNLAASDFLISLCLPIRILHFASSSPPVRLAYCNFGSAAFYLNMYASILFMGFIAANRYLKIVHPLGNHILQTVRVARLVSTGTWLFLLASSCSYIVLSLLTQDPEPSPSVSVSVSCEVQHSPQLSVFYKFIHTCSATIFLLVLISLVLFYWGTSRRLSQVQQRQPASSSSNKLAKCRRNMLVLVIVFCVCFVPYHLVRLPYAFLSKQCRWSQTFFYLKELTIMVSVLNVCLDPLIYFIFCKTFRAQLGTRRPVSTSQISSNTGRLEMKSNVEC